jgi:hypothetical protein
LAIDSRWGLLTTLGPRSGSNQIGAYLHQQGIDTSTPAGKALFQMLGVFDEIERNARSGVPWRPRPIKKGIRQREWIRKVMADLLKDERLDARDALVAAAQGLFEQQSAEMRRRMREVLRSGYSVLSLSANPSSILMWSHYSNAHQGFCIEYDFGSLPADDPRRRMCFPVLYRLKMRDASLRCRTADAGCTAECRREHRRE